MKHDIYDVASAAEQRVELDLSLPEFALIYALHYRHNGGLVTIREDVEKGLTAALNGLHPEHRAKVLTAAPTGTNVGRYAAEDVETAFASSS